MALQKSLQQLHSEIYDSPIAVYDYDASNNLIYSAICTEFSQANTDDNWVIKRYWYDVSDNLIRVKKLTGIWNNRANLDWGE